MKKIYTLLFLLLSFQLAQSQNDFMVQYRDGANYIIYQVGNEDTWASLATDFNLDLESLALFNAIENPQSSITKTKVDIPLTESNFYKSSHIHQQKGYQAVYYPISRSETVEDIARLYYIPKNTLLLWNKADKFTNGEKVIIGWLKNNKYKGSNEQIVAKEPKAAVSNHQQNSKQNNTQKTQPPSSYTKPKTINYNNNTYSVAAPKPIKNDPNRSSDKKYRKPFKETWNDWIAKIKPKKKETKQATTSSSTKNTSKTYPKSNNTYSKNNTKSTKDNSFKTFWNKLVNGTPKTTSNTTNSYREKKSTANNTNKKSTGLKLKDNWNKLVKTKPKKETQTEAKTELAKKETEKKKSSGTKIKEGWNKLVNGTPKAKKPAETNYPKATATQPTAYQKPKPSIKEKTLPSGKPKVINEKVKELDYDALADTLASELIAEPKLEVVESVAKSVVFNNSKNGKAAYFYSGPIGAKFYVVSNVAPKGSIVKVTNASNGKYIMAEIIGNLSAADHNKGIIAKVSDNAKMPLGSTSTTLTIKLSY